MTDLERRIGRLENRTRSLALDIAEVQLRELMMNRARNAARAREAERSTVADRLDGIDRKLVRLATLVSILIDERRPGDDPGPPATGEPGTGH